MDKEMKNLVLTFHNVTDAIWFEKTIQLIGRFFAYGTLGQLYDRLISGRDNTPRNMCFITFDDGERSVYEVVYPIIKRQNVPIAMFVSPWNIREGGGAFWFQRMRVLAPHDMESMKTLSLEEMMARINQLDPQGRSNTNVNINMQMFEELYASGLVTFGAHTQHHPILANESDAVAEQEMVDSIKQLSDVLGLPVRYFAYPNGSTKDFSRREIKILQESGIHMAFSTINGYADNTDLFRIKRVGITKGNRLHVFLKVLFPNLFMWLKTLKQ